jgi:hypothetical protein
MGRLANPPPEERPLFWCHGGTRQGAVGVSESSDRRPAEAGTGNGEKGKSMRVLKLCIALGLVLAVSGTAGALALPGVPAGPVYFEAHNFDQATSYFADPGTYVRSDFGAPFTEPYAVPADDADPNEDSWGLLLVKQIKPGADNGSGYFDPAGPAVYTWSDTSNDYLIVGMYGNLQDETILIKDNDTWSVSTHQLDWEIWAVPTSELDDFAGAMPYGYTNQVDLIRDTEGAGYYDGTRRVDTLRYEYWIDPDTTTPGAELLLKGTGEFFSFSSDDNATLGNFQGSSYMYLHVDANEGAWGETWSTANYFDSTFDPNITDPADVYISWNTEPAVLGWDVKSTDLGNAYVVPEPFTMVAVGAAVASLGAYLKRRRV